MSALLVLSLSALAALPTPQAELSARLQALLPSELALSSLRLPSGIKSAEGIELTFKTPPRRGQNYVLIIDHGTRRGFAEVTLVEQRRVALATHQLRAGDLVQETDLRFERRAGTDEIAPRVTVGLRLRSDVSEGQAITSAMLERPAPLPRGTEIFARVERAGASISVVGRLERPASIGDPAEVKSTATGRILRGILAADGTLHVEGAKP